MIQMISEWSVKTVDAVLVKLFSTKNIVVYARRFFLKRERLLIVLNKEELMKNMINY